MGASFALVSGGLHEEGTRGEVVPATRGRSYSFRENTSQGRSRIRTTCIHTQNSEEPTIAAVGLTDLAIVDTGDTLQVTPDGAAFLLLCLSLPFMAKTTKDRVGHPLTEPPLWHEHE